MKTIAHHATLTLLAAWLSFFSAPATASETQDDHQESDAQSCHLPVPLVVPEALFNQLIGWIALHTSYDAHLAFETPATLSFCETGEIVAYGKTQLIMDKPLRAAFDYSQRHVYLVRPWSPVSIFDQSVLLHELIHDIQFYNNEWECIGALEPEAYHLQEKWLLMQGINPHFDWQSIFELSQCRETD